MLVPLSLMAPPLASPAPLPAAPLPQAAPLSAAPPPPPPSAPLLPPPPPPSAGAVGALDWSSFEISIEDGALPDVELPFDAQLASALAKYQSYTTMLSTDSWDSMARVWGIHESVHSQLASAWRPIATVLRVSTDASLCVSPEYRETAKVVAAFFMHFLTALVDAELLCIYLKQTRADRVSEAKHAHRATLEMQGDGPELLPSIGGCFVLVEQNGDPLSLRLVAILHAILGLQCKSGCIGRQLTNSVAVQKRRRAATASGKSMAGSSTSRRSIPAIPSFICTSQGLEQNVCIEALILSMALKEFTQAWRRHFAGMQQHEWFGWDAQQALRHFLSASDSDPYPLGALALAVLLFLAKYSRLSPLSHTRLSSLYSVYHCRTGCKPWWRERNEAHLLLFAAYFDILCFGSPHHDGIETLQAALGFNVQRDCNATRCAQGWHPAQCCFCLWQALAAATAAVQAALGRVCRLVRCPASHGSRVDSALYQRARPPSAMAGGCISNRQGGCAPAHANGLRKSEECRQRGGEWAVAVVHSGSSTRTACPRWRSSVHA
mmetsp:Transcript_5745/g.12065  ORF Transcript_5745/g.12065 Transcript_5745/m.12065 type:complete len:549 (-) Transcript_5745:902-2548(-)